MLTRRERMPVMSLYEWNMTLWGMSRTRNRLDATGRGIYRELLDWCYAQGSIPDDHEAMARYCGATIDQFEAVWPYIKTHFVRARAKENSLQNKLANVQRKQYFEFISQQRVNGARGGKKRALATDAQSTTSLGLAMPPPENISSQQDKTREEKRREENIRREEKPPRPTSPPPDEAEWIRQALVDFMGGRGGEKFSEPPDTQILLQIWAAIAGYTTTDLRDFLLKLYQSRQAPTKSWAWFVSMIRSEFDKRRKHGTR
jgi:uncharacterized protein YdaU (DUF1376 family)